ncbi:MAG: hypothetical protein KME47_18140 [Nodosilinea sp. WJT8-NPBG4]|jgi:hypothetical protein|nr:hypothetical protein [Nodosilinea sp. WJT8-NPBG4]
MQQSIPSSCGAALTLLLLGLAAEAQAQQQVNFWEQSNPMMPWDYRQNNR